jgi:tetratricopeptide (TPR) repeat protein
VFELYLDFNNHLIHDQAKAMDVASRILSSPERLPEKQEINFYYKLATLYENSNNSKKAIEFYSKVVKAEPEYYVPHLALGYLYLKEVNPLVTKLNAAKGNQVEYRNYSDQYKAIIKKAIPHLEKATACDPNEETYNLIKSLYQKTNEVDSIKTLDARLKKMEGNCITVLTDF